LCLIIGESGDQWLYNSVGENATESRAICWPITAIAATRTSWCPTMPLLDHFRPPLSLQRHWESFHTTWASALADALNDDWLPPGYFAEEQVTAGGRVEIDVATFSASEQESHAQAGAGRATALLQPPRAWTVPEPTLVLPLVRLEEFAVRIYQSEGGPTLVAAIELVSPANKDRPETRRAFVTKCAAYLHSGISLVVIDAVTSRAAELHRELLRTLHPETALDAGPVLFAAAYRSVLRSEASLVECWHEPLSVGDVLPRLPLFIDATTAVPLDLEAPYSAALDRRRIVP
jgi:hypothetical protein